MLELRREELTARIRDPAGNFEETELHFEIRTDPLSGHTSRLLPGTKLLPESTFDLAELAKETRRACPFCGERIESATPKLPEDLAPRGRIQVGEAVCFPNLLPYSEYSSVSVYSPDRRFLKLREISPRLIADNLSAQIEFARVVMRHDPGARWVSINANYLPPSGSSVFHPHLQGSVNRSPTTMQRLLVAAGADRYRGYLDAERASGERLVADSGNVTWLASFAPIGPAEMRAFVPAVASPVELDSAVVEELSAGIAAVLACYAELGFESFNLAVYGAPPGANGYPLNLRMICRSNLGTPYRSDATWLERLHWEGATDLVPEEVAVCARPHFESR